MQTGTIVRISNRWFVRYWERRNVDGKLVQKRVSHLLGPVTNTRLKHPPANIKEAAEQYMAAVATGKIPADRIVTVGDFAQRVYLPWVREHKRRSTARAYECIWTEHLAPVCADTWMKNTRTFDVQNWLNAIGAKGLGRNTMKHIKSLISGVFTLAKQQGYFDGANPVQNTAISPNAPPPEETHAYTLEEISAILTALPEPAATAFAIASFAGLRIGEIEGLDWPDLHDGAIWVSHSVWNGQRGATKSKKSTAPVPVIRQLAERLEMHRLRQGNPTAGPVFTNTKGKRLNMASVMRRTIVPTLERCGLEWHGWHAGRRGLGSNLYRLGVPEKVIQDILRHENVATTNTYYVKTVSSDAVEGMKKLETTLDTNWTPDQTSTRPN